MAIRAYDDKDIRRSQYTWGSGVPSEHLGCCRSGLANLEDSAWRKSRGSRWDNALETSNCCGVEPFKTGRPLELLRSLLTQGSKGPHAWKLFATFEQYHADTSFVQPKTISKLSSLNYLEAKPEACFGSASRKQKRAKTHRNLFTHVHASSHKLILNKLSAHKLQMWLWVPVECKETNPILF